MSPPPLDGPRSADELRVDTGRMITAAGLGYDRAFALYRDVHRAGVHLE